MYYLELIQNAGLLVALVAIHGQITSHLNRHSLITQILSGFLFGCVAIVGMMTPVHLESGVIFDGRSIVLSVAGFMSGPITALIALSMSAAYRLALGGAGTLVGVAVIIEASAFGVGFYYLCRRHPWLVRNGYLLVFGLLVHVVMLLLMLALPREAMLKTMQHLAVPILVIYPLTTWFICLLFLNAQARISAEQSLRDSEKRYRTVADFTHDWEHWVDAEGKFIYVSPSCERITGYSAQEFLDDPNLMTRIIHPDDRARMMEHFEAVRKVDPEATGWEDFRIVHRNGETRFINHVCQPVHNEDGKPSSRRASNRDVTDKKSAESDLRESDERFRRIFDQSPVGIAIVGLDHRWVAVNKALCDMLSYSEAELLRLTFDKITHPDDVQTSVNHADRLIRDEISSCKFEKRYKKKSGETVWVSLTTSLMRDETGNQLYFLSMFEDISERKRYEKLLSEHNAFLDTLLNTLPVPIFYKDATGRYLGFNKSFEDFYGKNQEELIGKTVFDMAPPELAKIYHARDCELFNNPGAQVYEAQLVDAYGAKHDAVFHKSTFLDSQGQVSGLIGVILDVTLLRKAETSLELSEMKYRRMFQEAPLMYVITRNEQGVPVISDCNRLFLTSLGYSREEVIGERLADYYSPQSQLELLERGGYKRALKGEFVMGERQLVTRDGRLIETLLYTTQEMDYLGNVIGTQAMFVDITATRIAEKSERRLATAIDQTSEGVVITDINGTIQYVNPAMEAITGYSAVELVGSNPRILKSGKQDSDFYKRLWDTINSGGIWEGRFTNRKKNGQLYYEDATISPVKDSTGEIVNFVAVKHDVTEHLELTRQLFEAQKMEAVGAMAGGIAHDFNNLIQVVLGYAELMLQNQTLSKKVRDDLQKILNAGRRGAELVKSLMLFARKTHHEAEPIELNLQIQKLVPILSRTIPKMIEIEQILDPELAIIQADPTQMDQVLMNLAINARDAISGHGKLSIKTSNVYVTEERCRAHVGATPGPHVVLSVTDNGCGMDADTLMHIFEPFFTTKEEGKGTGLGLATVYGIVKRHLGFLECESQPGFGTVFKIYIPAAQGPRDSVKKQEAESRVNEGSETVLIVDDEEPVRNLVGRCLRQAGYSVIDAETGHEALDIYKREGSKISLIILDYIMPKMGGRECLEKLAKTEPRPKVVILTGHDLNDEETRLVFSYGTGAIISKPVDFNRLLQQVRDTLDDVAVVKDLSS